MKIGTKILLATVSLGVLSVGTMLIYNAFKNKEANMTKEQKVDVIIKRSGGSGGDPAFFMTLADDYINSWYDAVKSKKPSFVSGGLTFSAVTGKQIG